MRIRGHRLTTVLGATGACACLTGTALGGALVANAASPAAPAAAQLLSASSPQNGHGAQGNQNGPSKKGPPTLPPLPLPQVSLPAATLPVKAHPPHHEHGSPTPSGGASDESGHGKSGDPPGKSGDPPGKSGDPPGKSGDPPGNSGDPPGKSGDHPAPPPQAKAWGKGGNPAAAAARASGGPAARVVTDSQDPAPLSGASVATVDTAAKLVPQEPLGPLSGISYGDGLLVWPVLLLIDAAAVWYLGRLFRRRGAQPTDG